MTRRAPGVARICAVAAPSPDADPVTIAHKPSLDICIFLVVVSQMNSGGGIPYRAEIHLQTAPVHHK